MDLWADLTKIREITDSRAIRKGKFYNDFFFQSQNLTIRKRFFFRIFQTISNQTRRDFWNSCTPENI